MIYVGIDVAKDKHDCFITNSDGEVLFLLPICLSCHLAFSSSLHYNEQTIFWRILFSTSAGFPAVNFLSGGFRHLFPRPF